MIAYTVNAITGINNRFIGVSTKSTAKKSGIPLITINTTTVISSQRHSLKFSIRNQRLVASKKEPENRFLFAGLEGFEPSDDGVRVRPYPFHARCNINDI